MYAFLISSLSQYRMGPKYLTWKTSQVFIPLITLRLQSLISKYIYIYIYICVCVCVCVCV